MENIPGVIILNGPQDWQIIQRNPEGFADIRLEGTWLTEVPDFSVQVRVVNENSNMPVTSYLDWTAAELNIESKRFTVTLKEVPQGGLYRVETRIKPDQLSNGVTRAMRGDCIHHLGVGDIYVIAGQSNASGTGKGAAMDGPMLGVHLFANDELWKLATHPVEDATNSLHPATVTGMFHGHSPWLAFAKTIYLKTGIPVGLIPTALGGSPIARWVKSDDTPGDLFDNMADMVQKAGGKIAGVLWYQGESDATLDGVARYKDRFKSLVLATRDLARNSKLPIFTAQLNSCFLDLISEADWSAIREAQRTLSQELDRVYLIVTVDCPLSDEIHNRAGSNVWIGERFALAAQEHVYGEIVQSQYPDIDSVTLTGENRMALNLTFNFVSGDWTAGQGTSNFSIQDEEGWISVEKQFFGEAKSIKLELSRGVVGKATVHALYGSHPVPTLFDDNGRCITPFSVSLD